MNTDYQARRNQARVLVNRLIGYLNHQVELDFQNHITIGVLKGVEVNAENVFTLWFEDMKTPIVFTTNDTFQKRPRGETVEPDHTPIELETINDMVIDQPRIVEPVVHVKPTPPHTRPLLHYKLPEN